jgi:hypothetical protein
VLQCGAYRPGQGNDTAISKPGNSCDCHQGLPGCERQFASHGEGGVHEKAGRNLHQEFLCRERALRDSERKVFWLKKAEEWEQRALDETAFHFRECNLDSTDTRTAA